MPFEDGEASDHVAIRAAIASNGRQIANAGAVNRGDAEGAGSEQQQAALLSHDGALASAQRFPVLHPGDGEHDQQRQGDGADRDLGERNVGGLEDEKQQREEQAVEAQSEQLVGHVIGADDDERADCD